MSFYRDDIRTARQSVTDEDVNEAIVWLTKVKNDAIAVLDEIKNNQPDTSNLFFKRREKNATLAITALQQMAEGKEPCELCEDFRAIWKVNTSRKYCPVCGRKLRKE